MSLQSLCCQTPRVIGSSLEMTRPDVKCACSSTVPNLSTACFSDIQASVLCTAMFPDKECCTDWNFVLLLDTNHNAAAKPLDFLPSTSLRADAASGLFFKCVWCLPQTFEDSSLVREVLSTKAASSAVSELSTACLTFSSKLTWPSRASFFGVSLAAFDFGAAFTLALTTAFMALLDVALIAFIPFAIAKMIYKLSQAELSQA